jgi:hypothetical protein
MDMVVQVKSSGLDDAGNNSQLQGLQCNAHVCNADAVPRWVRSLDHIRTGVCVPTVVALSIARFRLHSLINLRVELGRHHQVIWAACDRQRCAALELPILPEDDNRHLFVPCSATAMARREHQFRT